MKRYLAVVCVALCACAHEPATAPAPVTDEMIERLLKATDAENNTALIMQHMKTVMNEQVQKAVGDAKLDLEDRRIFEHYMSQMLDMMMKQLDWNALKPDLVEVYRSTLTPDEIRAATGFYESEAGRAMVHKSPEIMRKSMDLGRARLQPVMPELMRLQKQMLDEIRLRHAPSHH